jgi:hypothetical protein
LPGDFSVPGPAREVSGRFSGYYEAVWWTAMLVSTTAQRSETTVDTLARVLSEDRAYRDLSHGAFADLLRRRTILTGWGRPWTAAGVRQQRAIAEQRL